MMMDKCIVVKSNKAQCVPVRDVKKGDKIITRGGLYGKVISFQG